jgi:microcystin-dependent protein
MSSPFLAEIRIFPYNFAPRGWAFCNGQILPISQNTALFSLIGTYYGGNGTSNFALPDLQGRVPVHRGQGIGLSDYVIGEQTGTPTVTLLTSEMPAHTHQLQAHTGRGGTPHEIPATGDSLTAAQGGNAYASGSPNTIMNPSETSVYGGSQPHDNSMPTLSLNFCIALQGIYPARN